MTEGLLVFVQLVMAAMTTAPWVISDEWPLSLTVACLGECGLVQAKAALGERGSQRFVPGLLSSSASDTRSCGRFGPASEGSTVARSSETVLV